MPGREFITLSEVLFGLADKLAEALGNRGYEVKVEPNEISLPMTPALLARRGHEKMYVMIVERLTASGVDTWIRYCQSCSNDTRIAVCVPNLADISQAEAAKLAEQGVGLVGLIEENVHWANQPRDLAFHAQLPKRSDLLPGVRKLLGEALDRFDEREWRTGFENACLVLEDESRKYLLRNQTIGRVKYTTGAGKTVSPSKSQIRRMTLGKLATVFCSLLRQNQLEARVCAALDALNPSRIHRIHKARKSTSEATLRRHVGVQMWSIINALSALDRG